MTAGELSPQQRRRDLERMAEETFDVVVVGGGVTGAGAALDAATRGLRVALVEAGDYASGTSSRSSKLIHGGLRYLEQRNFSLVHEALGERGLIMERLAPHLVRPVPFLYPLRRRVLERAYVGLGVGVYDLMAGLCRDGQVPRHRHLSRSSMLRLAPGLNPDGLVGAIRYYDAGVDDARYTLTLVRTAASYGAVVAPSARVTGFLREGERVVGVGVCDLESGTTIAVRAGQVINATGVWTDDLQAMIGRGRIRVQPSKGIHLVVPRDRIHADTGLILRAGERVLFVIPWPSVAAQRHWIIGTTDTPWDLDKAHPAASRSDIDDVLGHINQTLAHPLSHADVEGVYAGLRPLLAGESEATSKLSREHAVWQPVPGLVNVAGGKYTTYRLMAADAVDAAARSLDRKVPPSASAVTPLLGAVGAQAAWNARERLARESGVHVARIEHLLRRYGARADELLDLIPARPELAEPLPGGSDYLAAEVWYAVSREGALHLDDVLARRTRISIETFDRGVAAAEPTAAIMAEVLGWDAATVRREVDHYRARVAAERESQQQRDDATADAARLGAPDVRVGS